MEHTYFLSLLFTACPPSPGLQALTGQGWGFRELCEPPPQALGQWPDTAGLGGECSHVKVLRGWGKDQVLGPVGSLGLAIPCWALGLLIFK